jgi:hypothetical protein
MRLISTPDEKEERCKVCGARFAWIPRDLVRRIDCGVDMFYVKCPECRRMVEVWPSEKAVRKFVKENAEKQQDEQNQTS